MSSQEADELVELREEKIERERMSYWHMQLHPGEFRDWHTDDIREILSTSLIGCSGDPVSQFYEIKTNDLVLIRHGGKVLSLVRVIEEPRQILPGEKHGHVWFEHCARIAVLANYEGKSVSGEGWFLPKTLMPVENDIAYDYVHTLWQEYQTKERSMKIEKIAAVLKQKKQVILQGPPGTGKTRLAKKIAAKMIDSGIGKKPESITGDVIKQFVQVDTVIPTHYGDASYRVIQVLNDRLITQKTSGTRDELPFAKVLFAYQQQQWKDVIEDNPTRRAVAVAKYIYDALDHSSNLETDQYQIIQFHPSYTYEDFVRGIMSKPNPDGDGVIYEAENKVLATIAEAAFDNYNSFTRGVNTPTSSLVPGKTGLAQFIDHVVTELDVKNKYMISSNVYIFYVDDKRFKYKGDNWEAHDKGLNMNFRELEKIIEAGISTRADIVKLSSLQALTRSHATYYASILEKYRAFLASRPVRILTKPTALKNYVLIIDEINRANLSSVLGELIYALEYRGEAVESMYEVDGSKKVTLPPNLYIIGTMNTADRSVGHIDYAIRRRFAFVDVLPERLQEDDEIYFNEIGFDKVSALFTSQNVSPEFDIKDVQLGHSYFIAKKEETAADERDEILRIKMEYDVVPILQEYVKDGILVNSFEGIDIKNYIETLKSAV